MKKNAKYLTNIYFDYMVSYKTRYIGLDKMYH